MKDDTPNWAPGAGAAVVIAIFITFALVAAGGWDWFRSFLEGSAATWVGGIGSAAAAVVALYLAGANDRKQKDAALEMAALYKASLIDAIREVRLGADIPNVEAVRRGRADLEQSLVIGQAIELSDLPPKDMVLVAMFRALNSRCLHTVDAFLDRPGMPRFYELEVAFRFYSEEFIEIHRGKDKHGSPRW